MSVLDLFSLKGKHAVVAGSSGFLGQTFVKTLEEAGARVTPMDLPNGDIRDPAAFIEEADAPQPIDILINSAAIDPKVGNSNASRWSESLEVNLTGMHLLSTTVAKQMMERQGGVIVHIASIYGIVAPDQRIYPKDFIKPPEYSVTKAGVISYTRYLAAILGPANIRVNCLSPGGVFAEQDWGFVGNYSAKVPLRRMAMREELQGALLFLASPASSYMTGANLVVDGGYTIL